VWFFAALAVLLVIFRSIVPTWYEGFDFDSDQAIVGLMAKHLAEGRTFPLFFYGQNYMLGVQAWLAAPLFFFIGHPSVFLLRLPLVAINACVAVALIAGLVKSVKMSPALAFVAALPFVMPTPLAGTRLLQTLGASVEPFLYVLVLWVLRDRPWLFGAALGVGFLHREFTIFALPALLLVQAFEGTLMTRATLGRLVRVAISFAIVWAAVDVLKRHLNSSGPSAGAIQAAPLTLQMQTVMGKLCLAPREVVSRLDSFFVDCLPDLLGLRRVPMNALGVNSTMTTGSIVLAWTLGLTVLVVVVSPGTARPRQALGFCRYLALIGVQAVLAYPLSCEVVPGVPGVLRYALLTLLLPIAGFAWYVTRERSRATTAAVVGGFVLCAAINLAEHANVLREYRTHPPPNKFRGLSDYLVAHRIKYARAAYWDSYIVDFMSAEQVTVASTGKVRVAEYQRRVDEHQDIAVEIRREPCSGDIRFDAWCINVPLHGGQK
jgi:hypothetical protein